MNTTRGRKLANFLLILIRRVLELNNSLPINMEEATHSKMKQWHLNQMRIIVIKTVIHFITHMLKVMISHKDFLIAPGANKTAKLLICLGREALSRLISKED